MTNPMSEGHDHHREWDAAYVLGALSSAERREYEEHLASCATCTAAAAELVGVPGVLGALSSAEALAMLGNSATGDAASEKVGVEVNINSSRGDAGRGSGPARVGANDMPDDPFPRLVTQVRRIRRIRRRVLGGVGVAAAAALVAAIMVPLNMESTPPPTVSTSLQQVVQGPISANIELTSVAWGTKIAVSCTYKSGDDWGPRTAPGTRYGLFLTNRSGVTERVLSWSAGPGTTVHVTGSSDMRESTIARVELRALDTNAVLLFHSL